MPKVAERILGRANGKLGLRQCRAMASEYICELLNGRLLSCLKLRREYSIEPTANPVSDIIGRWQMILFVDC